MPAGHAPLADRGGNDVARMQVHKQPVAFFDLSPVILFPLGQQEVRRHLILSHDRARRDSTGMGEARGTDIRVDALGGGAVLLCRIGKVTLFGGTDEYHAEMHCAAICDHAVGR